MKNFHYTKTSSNGPGEALKIVQEKIVSAGFTILQTLDIRAMLKAGGKSAFPAYIVEFCDPTIAHRLLMDDPLALHFLPCNVLVFSEAEQTVVSASMPLLMQHFMPRMDLGEASSTIEAAMMRIVDAAQ